MIGGQRPLPEHAAIRQINRLHAPPAHHDRSTIDNAGNIQTVFPRQPPDHRALSQIETMQFLRIAGREQHSADCEDRHRIEPAAHSLLAIAHRIATESAAQAPANAAKATRKRAAKRSAKASGEPSLFDSED